MRVFSERWKPIALFLGLLLCALILTTLRTRLTPHDSFFETLVISAVMPLQEALDGLAQSIDSLWSGYLNLVHVRKENIRLQQQLDELQGELHRYREAYLKQQRLHDLLTFRLPAFQHSIVAEVVGVDPSQWAEAIMINKGEQHQVHKDAVVVTHRGLAGRTIDISSRYAKVLLLTDRRSAVDALVQRTRTRGIVVGKSRRLCEMRYVDFQADIRIGDTVISSGMGEVYPKGLLIGTVISVRQKSYELFQDVEIKPAVDLTKLEEVLVLAP
jgi:rod shape-determining protein MreC